MTLNERVRGKSMYPKLSLYSTGVPLGDVHTAHGSVEHPRAGRGPKRPTTDRGGDFGLLPERVMLAEVPSTSSGSARIHTVETNILSGRDNSSSRAPGPTTMRELGDSEGGKRKFIEKLWEKEGKGS